MAKGSGSPAEERRSDPTTFSSPPGLSRRYIKTIVTWTLTPTEGGTLLRMEQSGFRLEEDAAHRGASYGWQKMVAGLARVLAGLG